LSWASTEAQSGEDDSGDEALTINVISLGVNYKVDDVRWVRGGEEEEKNREKEKGT
jgi:hypothetical protein